MSDANLMSVCYHDGVEIRYHGRGCPMCDLKAEVERLREYIENEVYKNCCCYLDTIEEYEERMKRIKEQEEEEEEEEEEAQQEEE